MTLEGSDIIVGVVHVYDAEILYGRFAITGRNGDNSSETNVTDKYYSRSHPSLHVRYCRTFTINPFHDQFIRMPENNDNNDSSPC